MPLPHVLFLLVGFQVVCRMPEDQEEGDGEGYGAKGGRQDEAEMVKGEVLPQGLLGVCCVAVSMLRAVVSGTGELTRLALEGLCFALEALHEMHGARQEHGSEVYW